MTTGLEGRMFSPWEEEGRRQALAVDGCGFVLVIGDDTKAAAEVALGMARVQAARRRVVVADGVGLLATIDDLVPFDSPRGIADVVVDGVPIEQVLHKVDAAGNLYVLPSGGGVLDRARLMKSERWQAITDDFRAAEALLLVVVPDREPAIDAVLPLVDGVVLVGKAQPVTGARALAYVKGPGLAPMPSARASAAVVAETTVPDMPALKPQARPGAIQRVTSARRAPPPKQRTRGWLIALLAVSLAAEGAWYVWRHRTAEPPESVAAPTDTAAAPDSAPPPVATTAPDSSARPAAWAVDLGRVTSETGANARISSDVIKDLPAITYAPQDDSAGNRGWRVIAGAYRDRAPADSLLAALRARKMLAANAGTVIALPFAVLVQSGLTRDDASFYLAGLRTKGLPVYQLVQDDGTVRLYAGAFTGPADAQLLVASVRAAGIAPGVTERTGRVP